ncbi:hypothetical protein MMC24_003529 [Lignoscripta atroalba]|nr:hypothetical protein [Lignoscripta atroalba]
MPAQRPCASFDPISPDLNLAALVEDTPNFEYVVRISRDMIEQQGLEAFEKLVLLHVIIGGKPLVIEGFHHRLDQWTFTKQWLRDNVGTKFEQARNLTKHENMPLSINHYLKNMAVLTDQWNVYNYKEPDRQRIYLKDIDCPQVWHDKLKEQIPASIFYLNESTGDVGGPGSVEEANIHGPGTRKGKGVARAGDLMSCLPPAMRAENMMCYIGHEGTYTPAHREMCASLGQNLMVEASGIVDEGGKPSKPGSSIWFMTETKDRHLVSEYWLSTLGHDIEVEAHFAQINAWKAAPFTTYIVEQKVGDFILIPPLAPHQVWNRGTRTMKAAWNRTTVETLEMALNEALPRARMVCRDEQYKNKAIVLFTLQRYSGLLKQVDLQKQLVIDPQTQLDLTYTPKIRQLQKDFKRLFILYTQILLSEMLSPVSSTESRGQYLPYDSNVTCSYCRCNIFNRFLTCTTCITPLEDGDEDTYDICMECYAMGRSCRCLSKYKWVQQFPWQDLIDKHELWRHQIIGFEGGLTEHSPQPLHIERKRMNKKTLAQVCQEQLNIRPWRDPHKAVPQEPEQDIEDDQLNEDGMPRKRRKIRRSEKWLRQNQNCHICKKLECIWKLAVCDCGTAYCYGSLWRGFDIMPRSIMENPDWKCPRCLKICPCTTCRKDPESIPFEPTGTILGHDTKKIADPRSVESLVDFSHSNMRWIKKAGDDHPHETRRLQRRRDEAQTAKSRDPTLDDNYVDEECMPMNSQRRESSDNGKSATRGIPIDPQLSMDLEAVPPNQIRSPLEVDSDYVETPTEISTEDSQARGIRGPFPSVAAMLDEDGPSERSRQNIKTRKAAAAALHVLSGTSRLEQEPEDLVARAGLRQHNAIPYRSPPRFVALNALMLGPDAGDANLIKTATNGITYEYPDPTLPEANISQHAPRRNPPSSFLRNADSTQVGRKRKQSDDRPMVQSDVPSVKAPNQQFQQAQVQRTLTEARRNNRYFSAEAALSGKSLLLKLAISGSKLNELGMQPQHSASSHVNGINSEGMEKLDTIILRSDLPPQDPVANASNSTPSIMTKKRMVRVEPDDDFATRKPKHGRSSAGTSGQRTNKTDRYDEVSEDSEASANAELHNPDARFKGATKERRIPKYLANRNSVNTSELPKELTTKPRRQTTKRKSLDKISLETRSSHSSIASDIRVSKKHHQSSPGVEVMIDAFAAEPMPDPLPSVDLSTLGPGLTKDPDHDSRKAAEANLKAKVKAMRWAEGGSDYESESDPELSRIELAPPKLRTFEKNAKSGPQEKGCGGNGGGKVAAVPTLDSSVSPVAARVSIFSKPSIAGKKIRITSARAKAENNEAS